MTDKEFDLFLEESMDAPPPAGLSDEITPWRSAMSRVLWGVVWTTLTFNFLYLDVILPAAGYVMLLLGYRTLRRENGWFRLGYGIAILRLVWWLLWFALRATIYAGEPAVEGFLRLGSYVMILPGFLNLLALRGGIRTVQEKAGLPPHGGNWLLVWFVLGVLFAQAQLGGIAVWGLLIVHVCILRNLFTLSRELDEAGYAVSPAPVRVGDSALKGLFTGAVLLALAVGWCFFGSCRMDWQPVVHSDDARVQQIRRELLELGFPEHILDDVTEADILACGGAKRVVVEVEDHPVNDGRQEAEDRYDGLYLHTVYDQKELRITGIAVELPGEKESWKIIHHFQWVIDPGFRGTEALQLWPAYRKDGGWNAAGGLSGQVLYDREGQSYAAPFHSLDQETYTQDTIFWGQQTSTDVFAEFSLPNRGENQRGYISYAVEAVQEGWSIDAWINYIHQTPWLQYPVITAKEKQQTQGVGSTRIFRTVQDALQFLPAETEPETP